MLPYLPSSETAAAILAFYKEAQKATESGWNLRGQFTDIDLAYMRETDLTEEQWKAKQANKRGDATKYQNITVPVILPLVESAVTYQQSVFLTGHPIFGAVASPEHADAATQLDTINAEHQVFYNWVPELLKCIRNGFKYNYGPAEIAWDETTTYALEEGTEGSDINKQKEILTSGNKIRCLDPYNTFMDLNVGPTEISTKGEYAGYTDLYSRIAFKSFVAALPTRINIKEALESSRLTGSAANLTGESSSYFVPSLNPDSMYEFDNDLSTNWLNWAGLTNKNRSAINYSNTYEVATVYGRILPNDFSMTNVPSKNTPQVWKFIIVNSQVVIYAERLTNLHNLIPILVAQPYDDGLKYQTKGLAKNVEPFQEVSTALVNSMIAARRRAIGDRLIFDPSRISQAAMRDDSPIARIPVRASAFGTPMSEAVKALPFRDDQSQFALQDMGMFNQLAEKTAGLNPARQGNFVKGNKTRFEFESTMEQGAGRDLTVAMTLEGNFFVPMKHIIKTNVLQYQGGSTLFNRETEQPVTIDPMMLRKAQVEFKISDGLTPSDKLIDGDTLSVAFQTLAQAPDIGQGYNLTPMFSYLMKSRGVKLAAFEKSQEQLAYEQAVNAWQQAVIQAADAITKNNPEVTPQELQASLPPQPLPEQYGYNPAIPKPSISTTDGTTVIGRFGDTMQQQAEAIQQSADTQTAAPE